MVSDTLVRKRWWGYGLVFDRIYRINRIEGRQEERGRRGNHAESAKGLDGELVLVSGYGFKPTFCILNPVTWGYISLGVSTYVITKTHFPYGTET